MNNFAISTDSTSDFYIDEVEKMGLYVGRLNYTITENNVTTEYLDKFEKYDDYVAYFDKLKKGGVAKTSILNLEAHIELFRQMAQDGIKNAIHITQAMGLSPTLKNAEMAIDEVKKEFPDINYVAIESCTTTCAEGNLVKIAYKLREAGKTMEETLDTLKILRGQMQHFIVVDDLMYLKRGGRLSGAAAAIGTLIQLKPIIEFTKDGKLEIVKKETGIKKAYKWIFNEIKENYTLHNDYAYPIIVHTNNPESAERMAEIFEEQFGYKPEIRIMGPIIGAHVGPNAVALTFLSNEQRKY